VTDSHKENNLKKNHPGPQLLCKQKNPSLNKGKKKPALSTANHIVTPCSKQDLEKFAGGLKPAKHQSKYVMSCKQFFKMS